MTSPVPSSFTMTLLLLLLLSCLTPATGFLVFKFSRCPNVPVQPTFDLNRYLGKWYSYENFDAPFQLGSSCVTATYSLLPSGNIKVRNAGYDVTKIFGIVIEKRASIIEGEARIVDQSNPASLYVSFGNQNDFTASSPGTGNYNIMETDYTSYSVVYSCSKIPYLPFNLELAWILSRDPEGPGDAKVAELKAKLEKHGVRTRFFKPVDHKRC